MSGLADFDKYQVEARKTAVYPNQDKNVVYPTLGLCGEAGEVAENVKKVFRDDYGIVTLERRDKLIMELGDVLWYVANLAIELGVALSAIAEENLKKLWKRKEEDKIHGEGDER